MATSIQSIPLSITVQQGSAVNYNSPGPYRNNFGGYSGQLPAGLTFHGGVIWSITGTVIAAPGTYSIIVIPNSNGLTYFGVTITVTGVTTGAGSSQVNLTAVVGAPFSYSFGTAVTGRAWSFSGTLPTGLSLNGPALAGTPTTAGTYSFTVAESASSSSSGGGGGFQPIVTSAAVVGSSKWQVTMIVTTATDTTTTTTPTSTVELTWFQAETYARSGGKIARAGWVDRYLFHQNSLWWLQQFNAVTKALGTLAVVQAGDFGPADFRATDWMPAVGETITSGQLTALQTITAVFP